MRILLLTVAKGDVKNIFQSSPETWGVVRGIQPLSVMRDAGFGVLCLMNVAAWVVPSQSLHSGCDDAVAATRGPVLFWGRHEALAAAADDLFEGSCAIRFGNLSCFVSLDD